MQCYTHLQSNNNSILQSFKAIQYDRYSNVNYPVAHLTLAIAQARHDFISCYSVSVTDDSDKIVRSDLHSGLTMYTDCWISRPSVVGIDQSTMGIYSQQLTLMSVRKVSVSYQTKAAITPPINVSVDCANSSS